MHVFIFLINFIRDHVDYLTCTTIYLKGIHFELQYSLCPFPPDLWVGKVHSIWIKKVLNNLTSTKNYMNSKKYKFF
jgi:hypothetical protein